MKIKELIEEIKNYTLQTTRKTIILNAFAGAGAGKTTYCLSLTEKLKKEGYLVEYVQEYAKELVWDKNFDMLDGSPINQLKILKEQISRINRLYGKVDFIVTDAPILLNAIYNKSLTFSHLELLVNLHNSYINYNFFINRDINKYETEGRLQNLEESIEKDNEIHSLLKLNNINYQLKERNTESEIVEECKNLYLKYNSLKSR